MAETSNIEWTDATWNPVTGCAVVSPGCTNCYAMRLAGTRLAHHPSRAGLTRDTKAGPVWTGETRLNEAWLTQPLAWRRPRRIFVCAHGDLFAESVPDAWIDRVFAVMGLCPHHTFQVLTKRSARMRAYLSHPLAKVRIARAIEAVERVGLYKHAERVIADRQRCIETGSLWPLPNVWLGVSAEDQRRADERVPDLLATPAAVRFVSAEPLLGPIDLRRLPDGLDGLAGARLQTMNSMNAAGLGDTGRYYMPTGARLAWAIVGGESGPGARPMHPDWARSIRDQCAAAGVAYFFKQWGEFAPSGLNRERWINRPDGSRDPDPLPEGLGRHPKDGFWISYRVGKKAAGRLLDGVVHDAMPEVRP